MTAGFLLKKIIRRRALTKWSAILELKTNYIAEPIVNKSLRQIGVTFLIRHFVYIHNTHVIYSSCNIYLIRKFLELLHQTVNTSILIPIRKYTRLIKFSFLYTNVTTFYLIIYIAYTYNNTAVFNFLLNVLRFFSFVII